MFLQTIVFFEQLVEKIKVFNPIENGISNKKYLLQVIRYHDSFCRMKENIILINDIFLSRNNDISIAVSLNNNEGKPIIFTDYNNAIKEQYDIISYIDKDKYEARGEKGMDLLLDIFIQVGFPKDMVNLFVKRFSYMSYILHKLSYSFDELILPKSLNLYEYKNFESQMLLISPNIRDEDKLFNKYKYENIELKNNLNYLIRQIFEYRMIDRIEKKIFELENFIDDNYSIKDLLN